jgi:hypothetical protein
MNEAEYFKAWKAEVNKHKVLADPTELAMIGGKLCLNANPSFIFIAGYQAAIRATFTELDSATEVKNHNWLAYAASEDRSEGERKPGVTIQDGCLYGVKTWVAASKFVEELILKVGRGPSAKYVTVNASDSEISLSHKSAPRFLPDLSQGEAAFNGASFSTLSDLSRVPMFADCEPYYIYVALLSALSNYHPASDTSTAPTQLAKKASQLLTKYTDSLEQLAQLDQAVQQLLASPEFEASGLASQWGSDARLFSMYSKGVQTRHGEPDA